MEILEYLSSLEEFNLKLNPTLQNTLKTMINKSLMYP